MLSISCLLSPGGTGGFTEPRAPPDVLEGIEQFMKKEGINNLTELIGVARC